MADRAFRPTRALVAVALSLAILGAAPQPAPASQDDPRLDDLLEELRALDKRRDDRADELQSRIWQLWYEHDDPAMNEVMKRGLDALTRGRHEAAREAFREATRIDPGFAEAWNRLGTTLYLLERYEASLDVIDRVLELEPRHFAAWAGRGLCLRELGRPEQALEALRKALELNPHMDRVYIEILRLEAQLRS